MCKTRGTNERKGQGTRREGGRGGGGRARGKEFEMRNDIEIETISLAR